MKKEWVEKELIETCISIEDGDWIEKKDQSNVGVRLIQTGNIGNGVYKDKIGKAKYISEDTFVRLHCNEVLRGDILVSRLPEPLGRSCIVPALETKCITAVDCSIIRVNPKMIIPQWFIYFSLSDKYQSVVNKESSGTTRSRITRKKLSKIRIPLPSLQEQKYIVEKLDNAFAKIDAIKANAEKSLNEAQNLYKSVLEDLTKPCDTWSNNTLGDVVDFVRGPFGGSLTKNMFIESGYAVYEQQHAIHEHLLFRYFVDEKKYKEMERFQVHSGDLIMSCSGVIGRVVIIPENAPRGIINQALLKMSIRKGLINEYLCYLLKSPSFQKTIFEHTKGAAIPNLAPVATIKRIQVYLPSLEEQRLIVNKLDKISESIQRLKNTIEIVQSECSALKQSILRKAFNGEL